MYFQILKNLRDIANDRYHDTKYTYIIYMILLKLTCMLLFEYKYIWYMHHK